MACQVAPPRKIDVFLERLESHVDVVESLKAGDAVLLQRQADGLACTTSDGQLVGAVPGSSAAALSAGEFTGSVRTVRRQGAVVAVQVRFSPADPAAQARQQAQQQQQGEIIEEGSWQLSREQLGALDASEEVRWMLRDERLQGVIRGIDAAPDRERVSGAVRSGRGQLVVWMVASVLCNIFAAGELPGWLAGRAGCEAWQDGLRVPEW